MSELTEEHGDELGPTGEPFGVPFRAMFLHQGGELEPRKMVEQLIEQACRLYHEDALLLGFRGGFVPSRNWFRHEDYRRASHFSLTQIEKLFRTRMLDSNKSPRDPHKYGIFRKALS